MQRMDRCASSPTPPSGGMTAWRPESMWRAPTADSRNGLPPVRLPARRTDDEPRPAERAPIRQVPMAGREEAG